jgi:hypothetical protein
MKFQCCSCNDTFDEKDALCEDWSNPERSFICPHCETCLIREDSGTVLNLYPVNTKQQRKRYLIAGLVFILLLKPLLYLADHGPIGIFLIGTAIAAVVVYLRKKPVLPQRTFRVFRQ